MAVQDSVGQFCVACTRPQRLGQFRVACTRPQRLGKFVLLYLLGCNFVGQFCKLFHHVLTGYLFAWQEFTPKSRRRVRHEFTPRSQARIHAAEPGTNSRRRGKTNCCVTGIGLTLNQTIHAESKNCTCWHKTRWSCNDSHGLVSLQLIRGN